MKSQILIPPKEGWEADSYYVVEVAVHKNNPIHASILSIGSVDEHGKPIGIFNYVFNLTADPESSSMYGYRYIKAIRKIDMTIPNQWATLAYDDIAIS